MNSQSNNYIDYFNKVHDAEYHLNTGEYKKAVKLYKSAFSDVNKGLDRDYYFMAKSLALCNANSKKVIKYLKKVSQDNKCASCFVRKDSTKVFAPYFKNKKFKKTILQLRAVERARDFKTMYSAKINSLRDTIKYFEEKDRMFRSQIKYFPSIDDTSFWMDFEKSDYGQFQNEFVEYVIDNGFPGYPVAKKLGLDGILLHLSPKNSFLLVDILFEELKKGHLLPHTYSYFLDKVYTVYQNEPCTFYALYSKNCTNVDWEKVKNHRRKIGESIYYKVSSYRPFAPRKKLPYLD